MIADYSLRPPLSEIQSVLMKGHLSTYARTYGASAAASDFDGWCERPHAEFIDHLTAAGVDVAMVHGKDVETTFGKKLSNELLHDFVSKWPDKFVLSAGVDPYKGEQALKELDHAVHELGAKEANFQLFELRLTADDRRLYPFYARLSEWGVPVGLHCGINFASGLEMDFGHPRYIDRVAADWPDLKIIACPPGWPWVQELLAVAWRHENVHIGTAPVRPKYLARPGTGWEPLLTYGGTLLRDRIIFGTSWPLLPLERTISEFRELPVDDDVLDAWLGGNLARVLRL